MSRVSFPAQNFNRGEFAPELQARTDLAQYRSACARALNAIPLVQGPLARRPGTRFLARTKDDQVARLIDFQFSTEQAYVIEATPLLFRFYRNGGLIVNPTPVELATPWTAAQLDTLAWAQSADVAYLTHAETQPRKLSRTSHVNWTLTTLDARDGPWLDVNTTATTASVPAATGSVTLTFSSTVGVNGGAGLTTADVGRLVRLRLGTPARWSWGRITAVASTTSATLLFAGTAAGTGATGDWRLGAWGGPQGWPRLAIFHEQRLWFASTPAQPQTVWGSRSADFETFAPTQADGTVLADDAITFTLVSDSVNAVQWLASATRLILGTSAGAFAVEASSQGEALTPSNVVPRKQSSVGSRGVRPIAVDDAILFVQRAGTALQELSYAFANDAWQPRDLALLARHLTRAQIRRIAWAREPWSVVWAVTAAGDLAACAYDRQQEVLGWTSQRLGGTGVRVLDVAVIPGPAGDEVHLCVERTVAGGVRRFVERIDPRFLPSDRLDQERAFFVDCGLTLDAPRAETLTLSAPSGAAVTATASAGLFVAGDVGRTIVARWTAPDPEDPLGLATISRRARATITAYGSATQVTLAVAAPFEDTSVAGGTWRLSVQTVSGLDHLEGQTVAILADGATHPPRTVTGGALTLDAPATVVHVGLPQAFVYESLDLEPGAPDGSSEDKPLRIHRVLVRFLDTLGGEVGPSGGTLDPLPSRDVADLMDQPPPLFSGRRKVDFPAGFDERRIVYRNPDPLPVTIAALIPRVTVSMG